MKDLRACTVGELDALLASTGLRLESAGERPNWLPIGRVGPARVVEISITEVGRRVPVFRATGPTLIDAIAEGFTRAMRARGPHAGYPWVRA